jgi:soluble lytic murein transglycosylase
VYDGGVRGRWQLLLMWVAFSAQAPTAEDPLPAEVETDSLDPGFVRFDNPAFPVPSRPAPPPEPGPKLERADVAPYFATGKLKDAKKAFDEGRYDAARALLDGAEETAPVRYLRAVAALRARDYGFASEELERLAATWAPMKDRCLVQSGWAFEALKNDDAAQRVFAQVPKDSRVFGDARLGLARVKRNQKAWNDAMAALEDLRKLPPPLWGRDLGAEALSGLADVYAAKGDKKRTRATLIDLWSLHPLTTQAQRAASQLDVSELPAEVLVARGDTLIDAHRNAQGVELIEPLLDGLKLPAPLACKAHFAVGKGYRKLRRHARAIQLLGPVVAKCKDPDLRARALYTMGFSQSFVAPAQSAITYATVARDYPEHSFADDGLFFSADASFRIGHTDQAVEQLIALVDGYPDGDYAAEALFRLFWIARGAGQLDDGLQFLTEIEARTATREESADLERARYWRGRVLEEQGKADEAQELWASVAEEHPASYYGLISRERLEALNSPRATTLSSQAQKVEPAVDPFPMPIGPVADDPMFQRAVELLRLGFGELVPGEVLGIDRTRLPPESVRVMVHLMSLAGEVRPAHGLARLWLRRDLAGRLTPTTRPIWEIAYPRAFRDLVEQHCGAADSLDPDLLQALMREESALDPKALSWAGALGLCQLMPPTAAEVAGKLRLKAPSQAALLEPDLNLKLGARYLSDLLTHQKGVVQFALASYNAGEGAVGRWRRDTPGAALDEWVEEIPVQETRGYVKRVLRSYVTYKLLYTPTELARTLIPKPAKAVQNERQGRRVGSSVAGEGKDPAHH